MCRLSLYITLRQSIFLIYNIRKYVRKKEKVMTLGTAIVASIGIICGTLIILCLIGGRKR